MDIFPILPPSRVDSHCKRRLQTAARPRGGTRTSWTCGRIPVVQSFLLWLLLAWLVAIKANVADGCQGTEPSPRPNILFIFADDQRCDSIGAYGNPVIQTPNLDRLVARGFNLRNAYCFGSPHGAVCMPSRAMLHTGRTLFRLRNLEMEGHSLLGEHLAEAGYETFATGKWHNGKESLTRGFQSGRNIMLGGMSNHEAVPLVQLAPDGSFSAPQVGDGFSSTLFADAAIDFLEQRDTSDPFFCYVALTAPHDPRMSPGEFASMYEPSKVPIPVNFLPQHPWNIGDVTVRDENLAAWPRTESVIREQTAEYYGLISHMDQEVGRIMETLQRLGQLDNTIVVYAADHGLALGSHGLLGKQSLYEHSMKAPLIVAGPTVPNGSSEALVYLHDLFPTILELAGTPIPAETEGRSLAPLWQSESPADVRPYLFTTYKNTIRAIRDARWKLIRYPQIDRWQLFDLDQDPQEMENLYDSSLPEHQAARQRLAEALSTAQSDVGDKQKLHVANPMPAEIDLTGHPRKPDRWQPKWIVEKYFDSNE